jgi:hypothetical protein
MNQLLMNSIKRFAAKVGRINFWESMGQISVFDALPEKGNQPMCKN